MSVKIKDILYLSILLIFISCNQKRNNTKIESQMIKNYANTITNISGQLGELHSFDLVFTSKEFIELYETPHIYKDSCVSFLSDEYSQDNKIVAILSMNKLELKDYIVFTDNSYELFDKEVINEDILNYIIMFSFRNKPVLIKNYKNKEVQKLLKRIAENSNSSAKLKTNIASILSGETWKKLKRFKKESGY